MALSDVKVIVGGIIPDEDAAELKRIGVAEVFQPGASLDAIVSFIRGAVGAMPPLRVTIVSRSSDVLAADGGRS